MRDVFTPTSERDDGAERDTRPFPCTKTTWCTRTEHAGTEPCTEIPRVRTVLADPIPSLASPNFARQITKANKP